MLGYILKQFCGGFKFRKKNNRKILFKKNAFAHIIEYLGEKWNLFQRDDLYYIYIVVPPIV